MQLETNLEAIKKLADARETENDEFRIFLKQQDARQVDVLVHAINEEVSSQVDCTSCGNCCKTLMINVTGDEVESLAKTLQMSSGLVKEKYIEESEQGKMIINTIPCHFLSERKCAIYQDRFTECREFPHLHKPNFTGRLFGTMMYYPMCPIIFNVVERLKIAVDYHPNPIFTEGE